MAFMRREYTLMWGIAAVILVAIGLSDLGWDTALAFFVGALSSSMAGFIGMYTATRANVRTTTAAHEQGAGEDRRGGRHTGGDGPVHGLDPVPPVEGDEADPDLPAPDGDPPRGQRGPG